MKKTNEVYNFSFHHLIRGIILIGFMLLLFKLLLTGNITLLIAPKMIRFIYFTLFVLLILGVLLIIRGTSDHKHSTIWNFLLCCRCLSLWVYGKW